MNPRARVYPTKCPRAWRGAAIAAALAFSSLAGASEPEWKWSITPYLWAANLGVDVSLGGRQVVNADIPVSDLIDDVDLTFQVHAEGQRGANGMLFDLFGIELSNSGKQVPLPPPATGNAVVNSDMGLTLFEAAGIFDPKGDQRGIQILYGTRVIDNRADIDAMVTVDPNPAIPQNYDVHDTLVDGLFGVRWLQPFGRGWAGSLRADASAGGTHFTWGASSAISYAFGKKRQYAVLAGYRRLEIEFKEDNDAQTDMTLDGFSVGFRFSF